jgi:hypothetical protein
MKKDYFSEIAERRETAIAELDENTFAPMIRNHLVQLFRKAHAVEPTVTGIKIGMGGTAVGGEYVTVYDGGETLSKRCTQWDSKSCDQPKHPETLALFEAAERYQDNYMELPSIADITLADLETSRAKKSKVWGKNSPYRA